MFEVRKSSNRNFSDKLRGLFGLILIGIASLILMKAVTQIQQFPSVQVQPIFISVGVGIIAQCLFALVILQLVKNECSNFRFLECIAICYVPMLGKYIPGRVWTLSMSFWMYTAIGISSSVAIQIMTLTIMISLSTGLITTLLFGFQVTISMLAISLTQVIGIILFAFLCLLFSPLILDAIKSRWSQIKILDVSPLQLGRLIVINMLGWILYGVGFYALVFSVTQLTPQHLLLCIAIFPLAQLIGFISFMVPAGLGVREAVIVTGLSSVTGEAEAVMIALICRIWQTLLELVFALFGWIAFQKRPQTKNSS